MLIYAVLRFAPIALQVVDLNSRVQVTGGSQLATAKELLQQRHAAKNVEAAKQVITQARHLPDCSRRR